MKICKIEGAPRTTIACRDDPWGVHDGQAKTNRDAPRVVPTRREKFLAISFRSKLSQVVWVVV